MVQDTIRYSFLISVRGIDPEISFKAPDFAIFKVNIFVIEGIDFSQKNRASGGDLWQERKLGQSICALFCGAPTAAAWSQHLK